MKSKYIQIAKLLIGLVLIGLLGWRLVQDRDAWNALRCVRIADYLLLIFLMAVSYLPNGIQMRLMLKKTGTVLSIPDMLLLPISMSLWSYIIPVNGGFLYSLFFLSKKYDCRLTAGSAVGIFTIYISFILSGIIGLGMAFLLPASGAVVCIFLSLLLISTPWIIRQGSFVLKKVIRFVPFLASLSVFVDSIVLSCGSWLSDKEIIIKNILIVLGQIILTFAIYVWAACILRIDVRLPILFLIVTGQRILSLVRLLPGNLGIEEFFTGFLFAMAGLSLDDGLLISVLVRAAQFCILPIGMLHSLFWHFRLK